MKPGLTRATTPVLTTLFCVFLLGSGQVSCVKRTRHRQAATDHQTTLSEPSNLARVNINTATVGELEKLPGIGEALAARIVEHRERYGRFRRPEHLISVRGLSDRKFRTMRSLIVVE